LEKCGWILPDETGVARAWPILTVAGDGTVSGWRHRCYDTGPFAYNRIQERPVMKSLLSAIVTVSLLLVAGSAASRDPAPSEQAAPAEAPAPRKTADIETEPPELKRLAGSYALVGSQTDSAAVINKAIDVATAGLGVFKKSVARKRLAAVNKVVARLAISSDQENITVDMNNYVVTAPLDGSTADVETPSGETAKASFQLKTATLVQDIVRTKGRRQNTFRFNSDGKLVMRVRETSPKLASAVSYNLVFERAGR
jgi:hypothetical protein